MAIINSYPKDINIQDKDAWIGTDSHNRQTRQYTAEAVAKYLNVKGKVSIAGQVNYKFVQLPKTGAGTIALTAGGGDGTPFSALTEFKISRTDLSGQVVVAYLNFLLNQDILIVSQTDKEAFGHYTVTSYVVDPINPNFYTIQLFFLGGNGNIQIDDYYDITDLALKESGIDGSGTTNFVTKWIDAGTIGDSLMFDNGTSVGIGTTSPDSKLDVNGIISLGGSQFAEYVANSDLFTIGDIDGAGAELALHTDSGEAVRIDLLGNVGIGTTSPISRLDVSGGDIEVKDIASGIIMKSPDGTRYRVTIANGGALSVAAV